jgi:hypothetical protein
VTSEFYDDGIASWYLAALGERQQQGLLAASLSDLPTSRCLVTLRFRTSKLDGHEVGSVGIRVHDGINVSFRLAVHGSAASEHIFDVVWVPPHPRSGFTMFFSIRSLQPQLALVDRDTRSRRTPMSSELDKAEPLALRCHSRRSFSRGLGGRW